MPRKTQNPQIFTVRETTTNGFLGTYFALTAEQAIKKFWDGQASTASSFRRSQPMQKFSVSASVEKNEI